MTKNPILVVKYARLADWSVEQLKAYLPTLDDATYLALLEDRSQITHYEPKTGSFTISQEESK